jgi:hypothetical protein
MEFIFDNAVVERIVGVGVFVVREELVQIIVSKIYGNRTEGICVNVVGEMACRIVDIIQC